MKMPILLFIWSGVAMGQPGGTFIPTGSMITPRFGHTATLLPNGKVLIAGGCIDQYGEPPFCKAATATAELYDRATATFTVTGSMTTPRWSQTATLLPDGRVLIAAGHVDGRAEDNLASAELYDGHGATGEIAPPANPAVIGEVLSMYTTSLVDGGVIPPQVAVGGRLGEVLYFGPEPGYPGYEQVKFRVANGVPTGPAVPLRLIYLGRWSNAVTISAVIPPRCF
jgi:uncharacterized protein (TIGR03437 family)